MTDPGTGGSPQPPTAVAQSGIAQGAGEQQSLLEWKRAFSRESRPGEEPPQGSQGDDREKSGVPLMRLRSRENSPGDDAQGSHGAAISTGPAQSWHPAGSEPASQAVPINIKAVFIGKSLQKVIV